MAGNGVNNSPVDFLVVMYGDITKAHGFFQLRRKVLRDSARPCQGIEGLAHRVRWRHCHAGNEVRANVHAQLYGPGKVKRDDILEIGISRQRFGLGRTFVCHALEAAA